MQAQTFADNQQKTLEPKNKFGKILLIIVISLFLSKRSFEWYGDTANYYNAFEHAEKYFDRSLEKDLFFSEIGFHGLNVLLSNIFNSFQIKYFHLFGSIFLLFFSLLRFFDYNMTSLFYYSVFPLCIVANLQGLRQVEAMGLYFFFLTCKTRMLQRMRFLIPIFFHCSFLSVSVVELFVAIFLKNACKKTIVIWGCAMSVVAGFGCAICYMLAKNLDFLENSAAGDVDYILLMTIILMIPFYLFWIKNFTKELNFPIVFLCITAASSFFSYQFFMRFFVFLLPFFIRYSFSNTKVYRQFYKKFLIFYSTINGIFGCFFTFPGYYVLLVYYLLSDLWCLLSDPYHFFTRMGFYELALKQNFHRSLELIEKGITVFLQ